MAYYSIKDLEKLSGIKAHTIRVWEKRYGIIEPNRTDTNIRYYCDEELKKILNISILNKSGIKISHIAQLSKNDINEQIVQLSQKKSKNNVQIENLIVSMLELDENKFEMSLKKSINILGFEKTIIKIVFPFLNRIGVLWQIGTITPVYEHFISNLIRQKIIGAIDNQPFSTNSESKKFLLFLPEGEMHELGLLFYYYLLKKRQHHVIYLGQSVPFNDLIQVVQMHNPDFIVTSFISSITKQELKNYIKNLAKSFPKQEILISGFQAINVSITLPSNVRILSRIDQFIKLFSSEA